MLLLLLLLVAVGMSEEGLDRSMEPAEVCASGAEPPVPGCRDWPGYWRACVDTGCDSEAVSEE